MPGQDLLVGHACIGPELPVLPEYLGVGLSAYQLDAPPAGYLLKASGMLTDARGSYTDHAWSSTYCTDTSAPLLAAGSLLRKWFQQQN